MRVILTSFLLLFILDVYSQADSPPVVSDNKHYVSSIGYNFQGVPVSKGLSFYNDLGKAEQSQSWDVLTNRIWASEVRYDYFNRPVLQTLSAPVNSTGSFGYRPDFIRSNGSLINISHYDTPSTVFNPPAISSEVNTLGWYYSSQNTIDTYQDITVYPYTRAVYSSLNPSTVQSVLGGNKINGQWLQSYSFTMAAEKYIAYPKPIGYFQGKRIIKTVSRDVHGVETIVYVDTDGNTLAAARSGCDNPPCAGAPTRSAYSEILDKGFVDIHIAQGITGSVSISGQVAGLHSLRIFNLITEQLVPYTVNSTTTTLPPGFYRIEDVNNVYGKNNSITPIRITYQVNYHDYSVNKYDDAGFLVSSIQPLGSTTDTPLESTFMYNNLGQLLRSTSPDEGMSHFKYREDGQIRFSQNAEQAKTGAFSYTNYDVLGRPVESGVFYKEDIAFNGIDSIVNELDGLPSGGKSEQNFTVYDIPDSALQEKLAYCLIPTNAYKQSFIAGNVSYTYTDNPFTTKTWYSYDAYGRVTWMIQEIPGLSCLKTIDYTYNPIDGQLTRVDYQRYDSTERFIHKYDYNLAGQLKDVYTSTNDVQFTKQAHYIYNDSGALVRTELGTNLQGIDYTYNLNGQLKAINHPSILSSLDPGGDGVAGSSFASDLFGMALDYYNGDYTRTNTPRPITSTSQGTNQYNGNIKATRWNTQLPSTEHSAYTYQYNKNNWLTSATFGSANTSGMISPNANQDYQVSGITYDANGNIKTLIRNGYTDQNGSNSMDNLAYQYGVGTGALPSNRLLGVTDTQDNTDTSRYNDIRDQDLSVPTGAYHPLGLPLSTILGNYVYNDLGQLIANYQDKIFYEYNTSGLVTKINTFVNEGTLDSYKTVFYDDYTFFTTQNHGWVKASNTGSILGPFTFGSPLIYCALENEEELVEKYGYKSLQINGKPIVKKQLRVAPGTLYSLDFDVVLDSQINYYPRGTPGPRDPLEPYNPLDPSLDPTDPGSGGGSGGGGNNNTTPLPIEQVQPIAPSLTVTVKREDGAVIYTQVITVPSQADLLCERYYEQHVGWNFTTLTEEYITLEVTVGNDLSTSADDEHKSKYQKTLLDNLHLQAATATKVAFYYNDRGQRVRKEAKRHADIFNTYYVRDAAGSVMAIYTVGGRGNPLSVKEQPIYGTGRIGIYKRGRSADQNYTLYELTDHLGNVRVVFRKTEEGVLALTSHTDYYPFGMPMPNKHSTDENYRYAFQGQELDPETGMEAFELRLWDGRLGRWLTVDPYHEFHSPYVGMGNNPISLIDPDGGCTKCPKNAKVGDAYSHPEYGDLAYSVDGAGKGFWSTADGMTILNDVVITAGGSNTAATIGRKALDFVPLAGSGMDIYEGIRDGDGWKVALGATFLVVDIVTLGSGSLVKGTVKTIGKEVAEEIVEETAKQSIKSLRRKAVRQAWKQEKNLVTTTGVGTRDWTEAETKQLLKNGKVKGYQGHHINNVNHHPELAGNPANIEFVTRTEHLVKHGGNFKNKTTGELINRQ